VKIVRLAKVGTERFIYTGAITSYTFILIKGKKRPLYGFFWGSQLSKIYLQLFGLCVPKSATEASAQSFSVFSTSIPQPLGGGTSMEHKTNCY